MLQAERDSIRFFANQVFLFRSQTLSALNPRPWRLNLKNMDAAAGLWRKPFSAKQKKPKCCAASPVSGNPMMICPAQYEDHKLKVCSGELLAQSPKPLNFFAKS